MSIRSSMTPLSIRNPQMLLIPVSSIMLISLIVTVCLGLTHARAASNPSSQSGASTIAPMLQSPLLSSQVISNTLAQPGQPVRTKTYLPLVFRPPEPQPASITLAAAPERLPANGSSSTVLTVQVQDQRDMALPQATVIMSTTLGRFPNDNTSISLLSNETGTVTTTLTSVLSQDETALVITAQAVASKGQSPIITTTIILDVPSRILLTALPSTLAANVERTSAIRATLQDARGLPIPGYPVDFITDLGLFANGDTQQSTLSDASGIATLDLQAIPQLGTARLSVQAGNAAATTEVFLSQTCVRMIWKTNPTTSPTRRDYSRRPSASVRLKMNQRKKMIIT